MRNNARSAVSENAQQTNRGGRRRNLRISDEQRAALVAMLAEGKLRPAHARRLQVVLLTALGLPDRDIARQVGMSRFHLGRVRRRFERDGLEGMADRPRRGRRSQVPAAQIERLLTAAVSPPPAGEARWSLGRLASMVGLSRSVVYKILVARGVPPYGRSRSSSGV
jgi:transposase